MGSASTCGGVYSGRKQRRRQTVGSRSLRSPSTARKWDCSNPVFSSVKTPITHCGDEPKYGTIAAIDQLGVHVIVNLGATN